MSTATLAASQFICPVVARRPSRVLSPQQILSVAMNDSDAWVVEMEYVDSKGKRTRRTISPIRFTARDRFLGLCLCREEPRQFHTARCENFRLIPADQIMMPVEMVELS